MKEKIKHLIVVIIEGLLANLVWYIIGLIALNIPLIIDFFIKSKSIILNILSVTLTFLSLFASVFTTIYTINYNKNNNTEETTNNTETNDKDEAVINNNTVEIELPTDMSVDDVYKAIENHTKLINDIEFNKVTTTLKIVSCNEIYYSMMFKGVSKTNITSFPLQLGWSGTKYYNTNLTANSHEGHIQDSKRETAPYPINIEFLETIGENETLRFKTVSKLSDEGKSMIPITSFCVKYPIKELTIELVAPVGLVHTVKQNCYADPGRVCPIYKTQNVYTKVDENSKFTTYFIKITNPLPWKHYAIEWNFDEKY